MPEENENGRGSGSSNRWNDRYGGLAGEMEDSPSRRGTPNLDDFQDVSKMVMTEKPKVTFDDVIGCCKAKTEIMEVAEALEDPSKYLPYGGPELIPRGILLHGPPGTGKTMLAKALANRTGRPFISVQTSDIVTKWFGESERNLARLFEFARTLADVPTVNEDGSDMPGKGSIVFFDELDALGADRDSTPFAGGVTQRIVSVFLAETSGVKADMSGHVLMIGATNRLDAMDKAFKRPGRFDLKIEVELPGLEDRLDLLRHFFGHFETTADREFIDVSAADLKRLAKSTDKLSPAEIREAVRRALQRKAAWFRKSGIEAPTDVKGDIFLAAVDEVQLESGNDKIKIGF